MLPQWRCGPVLSVFLIVLDLPGTQWSSMLILSKTEIKVNFSLHPQVFGHDFEQLWKKKKITFCFIHKYTHALKHTQKYIKTHTFPHTHVPKGIPAPPSDPHTQRIPQQETHHTPQHYTSKVAQHLRQLMTEIIRRLWGGCSLSPRIKIYLTSFCSVREEHQPRQHTLLSAEVRPVIFDEKYMVA